MTDTHCIAVSFDPEVHAADNRRLKVGYPITRSALFTVFSLIGLRGS